MTDGADGVLREHGYRSTPQRHLVLGAVQRLHHATPEQILTEVHRSAPAVNLSTVYRVLDVLTDVGLVTHAHIGTGPPTYHPAGEAAHLHFRCAGCGRVQSLPVDVAADFAADIHDRLGFQADLTHAAVHGRCRDCAEGAT